jgi:hypothetical protein
MARRIPLGVFIAVALALAVGLGLAVSPYASSNPDGLEKVADDKGFLENGRLHEIQDDAPIPDYAFPGIDNARLATGVAGFVGVLGVFAIAGALAFGLRRLRPPERPPPTGQTRAT